MRVLKERILVVVKAASTNSLIPTENCKEGRVEVSGSSEIHEGDTVLFGESKEEINIDGKRYLLMHQDNVKVIYDGPNRPKNNVLPFVTREELRV